VKIFVAFLLALGLAGPALASVDSLKIADSVVILYRQTEDGSMRMTCTATAFQTIGDEVRLLTAAHCLMREGKDGKMMPDIQPIFASQDDSDIKTFARVTREGYGTMATGNDFAVLRAKFGKPIPCIPLGDERTEHAGSAVVYIGAPYGIGKAVFSGAISLLKIDRPIVDEDRSLNWIGAMLIQSITAGGASGSAVVSQSTGKIIGILVGHNGPFVIAIPVSRLTDVMKLLDEAAAKEAKK
jgi:hypothetical protein